MFCFSQGSDAIDTSIMWRMVLLNTVYANEIRNSPLALSVAPNVTFRVNLLSGFEGDQNGQSSRDDPVSV